MIRRALPLMLLPLALSFALPAFADVADGTDGGEDTNSKDDSSKDDDKGCSTAALSPVTGASLLLGVALIFGLRRRD